MGYGEAKQQKSIVIADFGSQKSDLEDPDILKSEKPKITLLTIPCFQQLVRIVGPLDHILARLEELKMEESQAWLEIEYTGSDIISNLRELLDEALAGSALEIRRIKNKRVMDRVISSVKEDETLDDLDAGDVFTRCLDAFDVPGEDRDELRVSYNEIIKSLQEEDVNEF